MSAGTTSGIETVHVRLLDEAVDVWRPVQAVRLGADVFRLAEQLVPADETWEFGPGEEVVARRHGTGASVYLAAVGRPDAGSLRRRA